MNACAVTRVLLSTLIRLTLRALNGLLLRMRRLLSVIAQVVLGKELSVAICMRTAP